MNTNFIVRNELLKHPAQFRIDLGKAPLSQIMIYENAGLIPKCITIGGKGQGDARKGYYPPVILEMIRDIKFFQRDHKFPGIRKILDQKYRRVFEIMDFVELWRLRYISRDLLESYLEQSCLTLPQKRILAELFDRNLTYKQVKQEILKLLSRINIKSETAT